MVNTAIVVEIETEPVLVNIHGHIAVGLSDILDKLALVFDYDFNKHTNEFTRLVVVKHKLLINFNHRLLHFV